MKKPQVSMAVRTDGHPTLNEFLLDLARKAGQSISSNFDPKKAKYFVINDAGYVDGSSDEWWDRQLVRGGGDVELIRVETMVEYLDPKPVVFTPLRVQLDSGDYTAVIQRKWVKIGCQRISFETCDAIMEAIAKAKKFNEEHPMTPEEENQVADD